MQIRFGQVTQLIKYDQTTALPYGELEGKGNTKAGGDYDFYTSTVSAEKGTTDIGFTRGDRPHMGPSEYRSFYFRNDNPAVVFEKPEVSYYPSEGLDRPGEQAELKADAAAIAKRLVEIHNEFSKPIG